MNFRRIAFASLAALSLGAAVALAQTAPPPPAGAPAPAAHAHHMMHHRMGTEMCMERYARRAAHIAYLETRLNLNAEQKPLWAKWQAALAPGAEKLHSLCMTHAGKPEMHPTIVERAGFFQEVLATKAASLQAAEPALKALYASLTPAQKEILDHPHPRWGHFHGHHEWQGKGGGWWHHRDGDAKKGEAGPPKPTP